MDALTGFPKNADKLKTESGVASLIKTDIFKGLMFYVYDSGNNKGKFFPLTLDRVKQILALNSKGEIPSDLEDMQTLAAASDKRSDYDADDLTGVVELPPDEKKNRKRNRNRNRNRNRKGENKKPHNSNRDAGNNKKKK